MDQQQQQQQATLPATPPLQPKNVRRSSLKMASSCLKKYSNQQLPKSALSPFSPTGSSTAKRSVMKKSSNFPRRRSSLTNCSVVTSSRRGHSDLALGTSSGTFGLSHLRVSTSKSKKLGRSISWDVRPPKVHQLKKNQQAKQQKQQQQREENNTSDTMMDDTTASSGQNESWYSKEEYSDIIKEQMSHIAIMRYLRANGTDESQLDPEQYCERGLESYQSREKHSEIDVKRKLHRFLVIREQARQSIMGSKDPELLRLMATQQSEGSLRKAQLRAALDQHEVIKKNQEPLTEEEKLQVAMAQHQKILQVKQLQELEDMVANQQQQPPQHEAPAPVPHEMENPTNGIMTLASLWAQENNAEPPKQTSNELSALGSDIGMLKINNSPASSSPAKSVAAQDFWKKSTANSSNRTGVSASANSSNRTGVSASRLPPASFFQQDTLMMFQAHGGHHSPHKGSHGGTGAQSQALQNAFCSTFVHDQQQQQHQHGASPSYFIRNSLQNKNAANVASVMPTSALAAMNLQDHSQQQSSQQHAQNPLLYASLLQQNSR